MVEKAPRAPRKTAAAKKPRAAAKTGRKAAAASAEDGRIWHLRLYVAGQTPKSITAIANLKRLCDEHLPGRHHIEIIDLVKDPARAQKDQIFAIPTLVRSVPEPLKRVIGDLSRMERALVGLELVNAQ